MESTPLYENQTWKYLIRRTRDGQVLMQTDNDRIAMQFCNDCSESADVLDVWAGEIIHKNY